MPPKTQSFSNRQHMQKNSFEVFRYKDAYMNEVALHHHDFYEVYLFLSGNVTYSIESRSYLLTPGDILLISPMELHQPMFGPEKQTYERFVLWINKNYLQQMNLLGEDVTRCFDTSLPGHTNLLHPDGGTREMLTYFLEQMIQEGRNEGYASELYRVSCLAQVMVLINRLALRPHGDTDNKIASDSVVYSVLRYINEHYQEDLSLDSLANRFFISKYHLSREFGRLVGTSVYRYIIQKRLVVAKRLMGEGVPSTTVYQHCGFGDYSNFYRAFKSEYQISPKEYMATLRQDVNQQDSRSRIIKELL